MEKFPLPGPERVRAILAEARDQSVHGFVVAVPVTGGYVAMPSESIRSQRYAVPPGAVVTDTAHWAVYKLLHEAVPANATRRQARISALGVLSIPAFIRYYDKLDHAEYKVKGPMVKQFAERFSQGDASLVEDLRKTISQMPEEGRDTFTRRYFTGDLTYVPVDPVRERGKKEFGLLLVAAMKTMGITSAQLSEALTEQQIDFSARDIYHVTRGEKELPDDARYGIFLVIRQWNKQKDVEKIDPEPLRDAAVDAGFDRISKRSAGRG